jgi:hypothetical protein
MDDLLDWEEMAGICRTQSVRFVPNSSYQSACPQVFGVEGKASKISTMREDCVVTIVEMFNASDYFERI